MGETLWERLRPFETRDFAELRGTGRTPKIPDMQRPTMGIRDTLLTQRLNSSLRLFFARTRILNLLYRHRHYISAILTRKLRRINRNSTVADRFTFDLRWIYEKGFSLDVVWTPGPNRVLVVNLKGGGM